MLNPFITFAKNFNLIIALPFMLITFEGIDGSGKSTIAKIVYKELKKEFKVVLTKEPTNTFLGETVKKSFKENVSLFTEALLFLSDHATHVEKIKKLLKEGKIVISDRYSNSCFAYQGATLKQNLGKFGINSIKWLREISSPFELVPDITFLLDISPEIAFKRISKRTKKTKFEKIEFLKEVRENYLKLANEKRFIVIDGEKSIEEIKEEVVRKIKEKL